MTNCCEVEAGQLDRIQRCIHHRIQRHLGRVRLDRYAGLVTNCPYCEGQLNDEIVVREMMFGTREEFRYGRCRQCDSLRLLQTPDDLSRHYPPAYYAFEVQKTPRPGYLMRAKTAAMLKLPPKVVDDINGGPPFLRWFAGQGVNLRSSILDVGSGSGEILRQLAGRGFRNLLGVDPFLRTDTDDGPVRLRRGELSNVEGTFHVSMMHHALEHVDDPLSTLAELRKRTIGPIVIRVPLWDSTAAKQYAENWVQLDAPRHSSVPTSVGLEIAAARVGLRVVRSFRDSTALQFWGSEAYRRDIPLKVAEKRSPDILNLWAAKSRALNAKGLGDQGCFILRRI